MSKHTPIRYSPAGNEINSWCHPEENGEYVKFSDYANLQRQNAELLEALEAIIKPIKPLTNFDEYDVVAMGPMRLIQHVKSAIAKAKGEV